MARKLDPGTRLVLASHNKGKLREITELLRPRAVEIVSAGDLGLAEPDDSGFCAAALGGAPGVHSARWAGPTKDFAAAMARVQDAIPPGGDTRAWFVCVLCLAWPDGHTDSFLGRVDGHIAWPARGARGFGYDPIFIPAGGSLTYGEMDPDEKHATSHRARAFGQMLASCFG